MTNVCGWTVTKCGGCGTCWDSHSAATKERAAALATHFVWAATGRRYGLCETTVMPLNPRPAEPLYQEYPLTGRGGYDPYSGRSVASLLGVQGGGCCASGCEVTLAGPVHSIVQVTIDGEVVNPLEYQVHDRQILVRLGGQCWPSCQRYGTHVPGFEVVYMVGTSIPSAVQTAVEALACEYAKACTSGTECGLPAKLASLTRQGVEVTVAEVDSTRGTLRTGIRAVDDVLDADNPNGLTLAPTVLSPDMPARGRTITWAGGS